METRKLIDLLRGTIEPDQRQQAEEQLAQIHKIIGFAPSLLQVVMMAELDMPIRQAGAIYLKNLVSQNWVDRETEPGQPIPFSLHEQDRAMIRDTIVDAIVHAPELIRLQLCVCVSNIVKHDFPGRWTQIVDKISIYFQNPDAQGWHGALLCTYHLVKNFEFKKAEERGPLDEAMNLLLPQLYQLFLVLMPNESHQSVLLQKEILKVYYALTQYSLPMKLISKEVFAQWMEIVRAVADRPVPAAAMEPEEDDRPDLPWWKCKKWALHILHRMFERYGSPGNVSKEYKEFAEWFLQTFTTGVLEVLLRILDKYRSNEWVPPRVLQQTLNYLNQAVSHGSAWKLLKLHMPAIIQDVLFPILSYSTEDEELWTVDPHEYIRVKFDVFEEFVSPVTAAQTLLHSACKKRKGVLASTMQFMMQVLTSPDVNPSQKDGALHMVGTLADILLKKKTYKDQLDQMFVQYVFPEFSSQCGHMRARACWVLHYFAEMHFKLEPILQQAVTLTVNALLFDKELPVQVEAAIALESMLKYQERSHKYVEPQIKQIALQLLVVIRETENEDLTNVMQKVVATFVEELTPIAVEICQHLATTFGTVLETDEGSDEKAITAMGILNTVETLLTVMDEQQDVVTLLEPTVLQMVVHVFSQQATEYYEEVLTLVYELTTKRVSPDMWKIFEMMYQVFMKNGLEYFIDMMPALHNYIVIDTEGFLSDENRFMAVYTICKEVLNKDCGEDPESHAAKLLEVVLLQCKGRIDQAVHLLVELAVSRLFRDVKTSELRTMCLQVLIAALYYDPHLLFSILEKVPCPVQDANAEPFTKSFIRQWLNDSDCFLGVHDRKLCVLGLCSLISMQPQRPAALNDLSKEIVPSLILLFDGLKRAYAAKAQEQSEEEEDEDDDGDIEEELSSDEDDIDEEGQEYLERLSRHAVNASAGGQFPVMNATINDVEPDDRTSDDDYEPHDETALESFETPLDDENCDVDEYVVFKDVMTRLQMVEPAWYNALTGNLTEEQRQSLQEISVLADQRRAAKESKRIEQSGGYVFTQQAVPTSFNFGGGATPFGS